MKISKKKIKQLIDKIGIDPVEGIAGESLAVAEGNQNSATPQYIIVTADPQFPWHTSRALNNEPALSSKLQEAASRGTTDEECKTEIKAQYTAIQNFRKQHAEQVIPVVVNGDITAFGHKGQRDFMYDHAFPILGDHVYLGLGNHDYDNNVDDSVDNAAATGSVVDFKNYMFNASGKVDNSDYYEESKFLWEGWSGSFSILKLLGLHLIQLNYFPLYTRKWSSTFPIRDFSITESIAWLEDDWRRAAAANKLIIVNMHWTPDDNALDGWIFAAIKALVDDYPPVVVFAGHTHAPKSVTTAKKTFGDVPVFIAGASFAKQFILAEYNVSENRLLVSGVDGNDMATKYTLPNGLLGLPPHKPSIMFSGYEKHSLSLVWYHPAPGVTYEFTNSKGEVLKTSAREYTEEGLTAGTYYEFRVCAILNGIRSGYSIAGRSTLPYSKVPEIVIWKSAEVSGTEVTLEWEPVETEDTSFFAHYLVYQDGKVINSLPGTTRTFLLVKGLSVGQIYRFQVEPYIPEKGKKNEPLVITL